MQRKYSSFLILQTEAINEEIWSLHTVNIWIGAFLIHLQTNCYTPEGGTK